MNLVSEAVALSRLSREETHALEVLLSILKQRFGTQLHNVILFGSKARGEATAYSDLDVLVILHEPTVEDESDARGSSFDVWMKTYVFLSLRVISQQAWEELVARDSLFSRNVYRDGVPLLTTQLA